MHIIMNLFIYYQQISALKLLNKLSFLNCQIRISYSHNHLLLEMK